MRKNLSGVLVVLIVAMLAVAVSAQEVTVEPVLPTVEVTIGVTAEATAQATAEPTTEPTAAATTQPTTAATMEATAAATAEMAVNAEMTTTPGDNNAYLRFAHFAPDGGSLDASLNGTLSVRGLTFPSVSEWIPVAAGSYSVTIASSGQSGSSAAFTPLTVDAAANTWQTIALIPAGTGVQATVIAEDYRELLPSTGGFTFFNALEGSVPINLIRGDVVYFAQIGFPAQNTTSFSSVRADSGLFNMSAVDPNDPAHIFAQTTNLNQPENGYTLVALIGPASAPRLFSFVTDESAVEIARGTLPKPGTLMDALRANENLTTFADALQAAGLSDMLTGSAEYTIFAPANFALDGSQTISAADEANVLKAYIVEGKYTKDQFVKAGTLTALDGSTLTITTDNDGIQINGMRVIDVNISATNGVIHMVNGRWDSGAPKQ